MNEQTYLNTICNRRKCDEPCKPKRPVCNQYVEYTCQTCDGKICLRKDECGMDIQLKLKDKSRCKNCRSGKTPFRDD